MTLTKRSHRLRPSIGGPSNSNASCFRSTSTSRTANTQRASECLASVLADYRARGHLVLMRSRPDLAARLANYALQHGIEADFVRTLIEHNALVAPADAGPAWPFRLRVRVLSGFELVRDGQPMRFTGKAQQRPLDMLKLLVALGGVDVDSQQLMAALWPDADGAAAKTSFDTTLFRLRKLLDVDNALVLAAGKLSLARSLVWTDVWALDAAFDAAERAGTSDAADASPARVGAPLARRLSGRAARYRGKPVDCEAAGCAARALRALVDALGRSNSSGGATGSPPSTSIAAAWKPTTLPSRSTAASSARWPRPAIRRKHSTRSGVAARFFRSCWVSSPPSRPSACIGRSSTARA